MLWLSGTIEPIYSKEGVLQGDPLSMLMYAVALVQSLSEQTKWCQNWYADDASCFAKLECIKEWFSLLLENGPKFGYYPQPSKSCLIVDAHFISDYKSMFSDVGVNVVQGSRFLRGYVGDRDGLVEYVTEKVHFWTVV